MLRQTSRMGNKSPHLRAILIVMAVRRCDTKCIFQCSMSMATPEATAIGQILALYCPGGHQGNSKQNNDDKCTNFAVRFDGCGGKPVLYHRHRLMEEAHGFHRSH